MSIIQTAGFAIPQDEVSLKKIRGALDEISNHLTSISAKRDAIKDIIKTVSEEYELPAKYVRKIANIHHKQNFATLSAENEQVEILYETVSK